ncbi:MULTISPECIES: acyltransferase family protein [unclassified Serratia (in: enterobacteria)]|uniref:acyltransferase family protein n=1 Tax=unclassified Serratia (in: enterobacteria) TaxID=2647522 RepID=UPI0030761AB5
MSKIPSSHHRLLSLDVLRGMTIAGMILVNNPGSWSYVYAPLGHASWHGLTPTDLVFPFFMFIMGISTYISLQKSQFSASSATITKILTRTLVIFMIGLFIAWFALFLRTSYKLTAEGVEFWQRVGPSLWNFEHIRILGVMQRLAICYAATAIIALLVNHKYIPHIIVTLLLGYYAILLAGNGFEQSEQNIISQLDQAILGVNHMYKDAGLAIDPEGLLSTLPAIAHVLLGFYCGKILSRTKDIQQKVQTLFIIGTSLTFIGFLLSYGCPINKKIWSPTFVLVTCGLAASFLALLMWIIDIQGKKTWCRPFEAFGINPLFIYVNAAFLSLLLNTIPFGRYDSLVTIHQLVYDGVLRPLLGDYPSSLAYALLFLCVNWSISSMLYRRQIYIKI